MSRSRSTCRWLIAVLALSASARAQAPASPSSAQAQSLFDGGRALLQAGKLAEACAAFDSSEKLEPRPTTLLNLASCREKIDQLASARVAFAEAGRLARTQNNYKLVAVALNHLRQIEPRVSKLTLVVPADRAVPGLELLRNGEKLDAATWNHPSFVDGGSYTITARAPGRTPWTVTRQIQVERDNVQIEIPRLVDPSAAVAVAPRPPPAPPPVTPPAVVTPPPPSVVTTPPASSEPAQVDTGSAGPSYTAPLVVGAGALALAGVGVYFELHSHTTRDTAEHLNSIDPGMAKAKNDDASSQRITGEIFDLAAVAAAGVAVYLGVRVHRAREAEVAIAPIAGPQLTGVALSGRW